MIFLKIPSLGRAWSGVGKTSLKKPASLVRVPRFEDKLYSQFQLTVNAHPGFQQEGWPSIRVPGTHVGDLQFWPGLPGIWEVN